jgi:hypothetical protein
MAIIVIGGQSRNIGKTSVVCGLIAAMSERRWTAVKMTQCKHDTAGGELCDCELGGRSFAMDEEWDPTTGMDSSRYLTAGAVHSLWVRVRAGCLGDAMERIRAEIDSATNVILESNSVIRYLTPDVYAVVLDSAVADFKPSARQYLDRADAILIPAGQEPRAHWSCASADLMQRARVFRIEPPRFCPADFVTYVTRTLDGE